ncbi:MAG: ShlB/FhaC/HecB family hemolysin secretion/activation protein [Gemmatimonadales bacterium]
MGPGLLTLALLAGVSPNPQPSDTATYGSAATRELIARAMARHRMQDTAVRDYRAELRYRLTAGIGRRRWGSAPPVAVEEQAGRVAWQLPNDLRVEILGQRSRVRESGAEFLSTFNAPWFVPRGLSDSVRVFGTDFPERASLHPLAPDGPDWYRYEAGDTVALTTGDGRRLELTEVRVMPKRPGPALLAGKLWLELATAQVVRLAFRYVGTDLWETPSGPTAKDSAAARRANRLINRFLSLEADLEYALQDGEYWMPYRQILSGRVQVPLITDIYVPFEAVTTFFEYAINTGGPVAFRLPEPDSAPPSPQRREERRAQRDSLRAERRGPDSLRVRERAGRLPGGGRYEMWRASRDSLRRYIAWEEPLRLRMTEEEDRRLRETRRELADLVEALPRDVTGIDRTGFAYERLADAFRFNRVQGTSIGLGYQVDLRGLSYTSLFATARFGLTDKHPTARLSLIRDAPSGRITLSAYHDLWEGDPWGQGLSAANSLRALLSGRDEGEYFRATGGLLTLETGLTRGVELTLTGRFERQRSATGGARAWLNDAIGGDGVLPPNPPIEEGDYATAGVRLGGRAGRARWELSADGTSDLQFDATTARLYGQWRQPIGGRTGATVRARAGVATRPLLPQLAFRAGGQASVRGFDYGYRRGEAFWAVQTDVTPWRGAVRPVVFLDAGQAGRLDSLTSTRMLIGGGLGLSVLNGLLRFDLSHPVSPRPEGMGLRLDLVFGAPR